ncbi:MAG: hypothetical protein JNK76_07775 [Planctomycetales bacterium]|nr:hypothetical protein [Planctomycetales bacterium]MBN8626162.1 hypothetical protein [Planctomycetota bacterium]
MKITTNCIARTIASGATMIWAAMTIAADPTGPALPPPGSGRATMPWTVPPPNTSSPQPSFSPGSQPPTDLSSAPPAGRKLPSIDFDEIEQGSNPTLKFAGRNGAVLDGPRKGLRQREGTKMVERRGRFEVNGDRVVFLAQEPDAHFVVLENLALERVVRAIEESGPQMLWSISGTLTEYRSTNFLMISRATIRSIPGQGDPIKAGDPTAATAPGKLPTAGDDSGTPRPLAPPTAAREFPAAR